MGERTYTELEIAQAGFKEFKIPGDNGAFRKQISAVIKKYKSNGEYQKIAEEYNKNYDDILLEQAKSEAFYMEHGYFEGQQDGIPDDVNRVKNKIIIESLSKIYIEEQANDPQKALQNAERLTNVFKSSIISEKLFSALYDFRVEELTSDLYKSKEISQTRFDDLTKEDMRLFDKLDNWENYVSCKVNKTKS